MNGHTLHDIVALANEVGHVLVATASTTGVPHLAAAGRIFPRSEEHVAVTDWFCPGTMRNLEDNAHATLIVWDATRDHGYQLLGEVVAVNDVAALGCLEADATEPEQPTVERELVVHIGDILTFTQGPHTDTPSR